MGQEVNGYKRRHIKGGGEGKVLGLRREGSRKKVVVFFDQAGFAFSREGFRACESLIV